MLRANKEDLPILLVQGQVWHPRHSQSVGFTAQGKPFCLPNTGGITYNAKIGDRCIGWAGDHLEPGVTTRNPDEACNLAYVSLSCIGNPAIVVSGEAKGERGFVTGKHGGVGHVVCWFRDEALGKMTIGDRIDVHSCGQGMVLHDYPDVHPRNMSPDLLDKMNIVEDAGRLRVGVAKIVPAVLMGSGLGHEPSEIGDYDITLHDERVIERYGLSELRFGDIVAIADSDTRYGRTYRTGSITVGVVVHGDSRLAGHGPGVSTIMTGETQLIDPFIDQEANLAGMFLRGADDA